MIYSYGLSIEAAGSADIGALAATQGANTLAAAGTVKVGASLSTTQGAQAVAAAGSVTVSGDASSGWSRASSGTYIDASGVMRLAPANVPRIDHDPKAGHATLGPLIEAASTNIENNSLGAGYGAQPRFSSVISTDVASIYPAASVRKVTDLAGTGDNNAGNGPGLSVNAGDVYSFSLWVWIPSSFAGTSASVGLGGNFQQTGRVDANLSLRDQWQRISVSGSANTTATGTILWVFRPNTAQGDYFYWTCPQTEISPAPTSFIPTSSGPVSRAADQITAPSQTLSAAGGPRVAGPLAATQAANTLAAAAGPVAAATLSQGQAAQTLAAAGSTRTAAALTAAQAANTVSAAGVTRVAGTLTQGQAANSLAAAGGPLDVAAFGVTQAPNSLAATGKVLAVGALSQGQAGNTLAAAGGPLVSASLTAAEAPNAFAGVCIVGGGAALTATQAAQTLSATGSVPIVGNASSGWSRASSATYIDASGVVRVAPVNVPRIDHSPTSPFTTIGPLIEGQSTNLLTNSGSPIPPSTGWSQRGNPTFTAGQPAPDGSNTAVLMVPGTSVQLYDIVQFFPASTGTAYTFTGYVKPAGYTWIHIQIWDFAGTNGGGIEAWINLTGAGSVGQVSNAATGFGATASVSLGPGGFYRFQLTGTPSVGSVGTNIQVDLRFSNAQGSNSCAGDGHSGYVLWGFQVEQGTAATSYIPTGGAIATRAADQITAPGQALVAAGAVPVGGALSYGLTRASSATYLDANGVMQMAAPNVPRQDRDPSTLALTGALIEGQRTNLIPNSATVGPGWASALSTDLPPLLAGNGIWKATTPNGNIGAYTGLTVTPGTTYVASVWVFLPSAWDAATGTPRVDIDMGSQGTGAFGVYLRGDLSKRDQWQRISTWITFGPDSSNRANVVLRLSYGNGAAGQVFYTTCWQFEQTDNQAASSYIPTYGTSQTRAADIITAPPQALAASASTVVVGSQSVTQGAQALSAAAGVSIVGQVIASQAANTVAAAGGGKVVGTLTASQPGQSLAASARAVVSGSLAVAQAANGVAASGAETVVGAVTASQAGQTLSAAAAVRIAGQLATTQAANAVVSTASDPVVAALNAGQGAQTLSASAAATFRPTLAVTQGSQMLSAAAGVAVVGGLLVAAAPQTGGATGKVIVSGSAALGQAANTLAAGGGSPISGSVSFNQPAQGLAANGGSKTLGGLTAVQEPHALTAGGGPVMGLSLAVTQVSETLSASATVKVSGSAAAAQAAQAASAAGGVLVGASVACTQAAQAASANGKVVVTGALTSLQAAQQLVAQSPILIGAALAVTQQPGGVAAAGAVRVSGALAATQAAQVPAAQAAVTVSGGASVAQASQTVAAVAGVFNRARVQGVQPDQGLASAASVTVGAALTCRQASDSLAATLSISQFGISATRKVLATPLSRRARASPLKRVAYIPPLIRRVQVAPD